MIPCIAFLTLAMAVALSAQRGGGDDGAYIGSESCARCHAAQYAAQATTGHARSLHKAASHPLIASVLSAEGLTRPPNFQFRFRLLQEHLLVKAHDGQNVMDIPVDWAFGAGDQAVTFVSRIDANWYLEHYYSFYSATGRMAPTAGHSGLRPKSLPEAMGLPYKTSDPQTGIRGCFECHSTGPLRVDTRSGLQPLETGVRCESCHGAGRAHAAAAASGSPERTRQTILNPKRFSATALNEFCGRCHRPPGASGTAIDWSYSWNVRHQPVYFSQSKCMEASGGKLSCFTCHEPHQPLQKSSAVYNERCLGCHAEVHKGDNRRNCIDCHMPRVSPQQALRFTNHWIGIYGEGSKLKPR